MSEIPEAAEARNPGTPPERLGDLADAFPELHRLIVVNPACPPDLRSWILEEVKDPMARRAWQAHQKAQAGEATTTQMPAVGSAPTAPMPALGRQGAPPAGVLRAGAPYAAQAAPRRRSSGCLVASVLTAGVLVLAGSCTAYVASQLSGGSGGSSASSSQEAQADPAPVDAISADLIQSPSLNISCEIGTDSVSCSIAERYYAENGQEDCDASLFSLTTTESTALACGEEFIGVEGQQVHTLEYGTSAANDTYACSSEETGMTCWNQWTGHGFTLNRTSYETF
ncbi:hypothetical protein NSA19_08115 [Actinomyces bowdenii]|uniref:variant leucine-rich repeat-containing protein n=1 Tax=Actinomyces bowdenii TaxID=131109 RepID=UPI00214C2EFA|nr:hypothetical protein [Actinomyces bowdenii]MCR2052807.1 hypothetical protein [Actinomyces bowdenii]